MRRLSVFNTVTLDGYFTGIDGDMSWAHAGSDDLEFAAFTAGNAQGGGALVFGRVTYAMMAGWWPTPAAAAAMPVVAERMNGLAKYVFSRTLDVATWANTTLLKGDLVAQMRALKNEDGPDMTILGSGTIVAQLAGAGLVDAVQVVVAPIALGAGRTMFDTMVPRLNLSLTGSRAFKNGKVVLSYAPTP